VDTERLKIIFNEDQKFFIQDLLPQMKAAGLRVIAMVNSMHYFAGVGAKSITNSLNPDEVAVQYFQSKKSALEWLKSLHDLQ
jgi:hypothetical protein